MLKCRWSFLYLGWESLYLINPLIKNQSIRYNPFIFNVLQILFTLNLLSMIK